MESVLSEAAHIVAETAELRSPEVPPPRWLRGDEESGTQILAVYRADVPTGLPGVLEAARASRHGRLHPVGSRIEGWGFAIHAPPTAATTLTPISRTRASSSSRRGVRTGGSEGTPHPGQRLPARFSSGPYGSGVVGSGAQAHEPKEVDNGVRRNRHGLRSADSTNSVTEQLTWNSPPGGRRTDR